MDVEKFLRVTKVIERERNRMNVKLKIKHKKKMVVVGEHVNRYEPVRLSCGVRSHQ